MVACGFLRPRAVSGYRCGNYARFAAPGASSARAQGLVAARATASLIGPRARTTRHRRDGRLSDVASRPDDETPEHELA